MGFSNRLNNSRIIPLFMAAAALIALLPTNLLAQEKLQRGGGSAPVLGPGNEPVLVVTVGSINKLMEDVNYITGIAGQAGAGGMFQMMAATFTNGIDKTQPIGIIVPMVNGMPDPIAVIPTSDIKSVLKRLEAQTGPVDELDDGTLVIAVNANTVYIRQVGNWAIAGRTRDILSMAPADPTQLFTGMGNNYDLAFRLRVQQIPEDTRGMLTAQMRQGFEQAMAQQGEDTEQVREMAENTIKQLEMILNESDELNFGINIDPVGKHVLMDFGFTALQGTKLAAVYGGQQAIPSKFASVIRDDAAAYLHAATSVSPDAAEMARSSIESSLSTLRGAIANDGKLNEQQQREVNDLIDRLAKVYLDSVSEGKMDMGGMLLANEDDFRFVFGGFVSDGNEVAQIVKDVAAKIEAEAGGDAPRFKFDQGTYSGVTMHVVEADVPAREEEVQKVFGDVLRVHIGTGPKSVYIAAGKNSEALLKGLIDTGSDTGAAGRPVSQFRLTLLPILKFARSVADDNEVIDAMIATLAGASDPGEITATGEALPLGTKSRITIGEGLIQAIGQAAAQGRGRAPGQF